MTHDSSRTERHALVRTEVQRLPMSATDVDTYRLLSDRGRGAELLSAPAGKIVKLHESDRIRFGLTARDLVTESVLKVLRGKPGLEGGG